MGYSDNDAHVRCDRFKPSGKWYDTFMIDMSGMWEKPNHHAAVANAILKKDPDPEPGWFFVVLEPHHVHSHPVLFTAERVRKESK